MNYTPRLVKSKCIAENVEDFVNFGNLTQTMATRAAFYIMQAKKLLKNPNYTEKQKHNEKYAIAVQRMIKAHIAHVMYQMARTYIKGHEFKDPKIAPLLNLCVRIFALKTLLTDTQGLYECGYFGEGSQQLVEDSLHKCLNELRPQMIPIVESFKCDSLDHNTIGNQYGDIYELQLDTAKKTRLNKQPVPSFYDKYMKPTMTMYKAKL